MAQRSSIESDPEIAAEALAALKRGQTIDEILDALRALGAPVSRSAVGRYARKFRAIAEEDRAFKASLESYKDVFGGEESKESRLVIQLLTTLTTRALIEANHEEASATSTKDLSLMARTTHQLMSSMKISDELEIRRDERAKTKEKAAEAVEETGKAAGASPETIRKIKSAILGLPA